MLIYKIFLAHFAIVDSQTSLMLRKESEIL